MVSPSEISMRAKNTLPPEILRCKRCGGSASVQEYSEGVYVCGCDKRHCWSGPETGTTSEVAAILAWNEWTQSESPPEENEIDLGKFIEGEQDDLMRFVHYWKAEQKKTPERFPEKMPYGEWWEQFAAFCMSIDYEDAFSEGEDCDKETDRQEEGIG
jgi:hypothetical protein